MMKFSPFVALLASAMLLSACSKHAAAPDAPKAQPAAAATATASASAADETQAPRAATYDPNLKPAEIVWDSQEKKAQWEARQAQLQQGATTQAAAPAAQQAQPQTQAAPAAN